MAERRGCIAGEQVWITSTPAHNPQLPSHKVAPAASEDWPPMVWKCTCTFECKGADCSPVQVDRQSWILKPPIHTSYFVLASTLQKHKSWHKINPQDIKAGKMSNFSILLVIQIMCLAWSWTGLIASLNLPYPRISIFCVKVLPFGSIGGLVRVFSREHHKFFATDHMGWRNMSCSPSQKQPWPKASSLPSFNSGGHSICAVISKD